MPRMAVGIEPVQSVLHNTIVIDHYIHNVRLRYFFYALITRSDLVQHGTSVPQIKRNIFTKFTSRRIGRTIAPNFREKFAQMVNVFGESRLKLRYLKNLIKEMRSSIISNFRYQVCGCIIIRLQSFTFVKNLFELVQCPDFKPVQSLR